MKAKSTDPELELYRQIIADLDRQWELIEAYAAGDRSVRQEIKELQGAIKIKGLVARGARKQEEK